MEICIFDIPLRLWHWTFREDDNHNDVNDSDSESDSDSDCDTDSDNDDNDSGLNDEARVFHAKPFSNWDHFEGGAACETVLEKPFLLLIMMIGCGCLRGVRAIGSL